MLEQTECNRCLQEHPPTIEKNSNGKTIELSWYDERGICRKCGPEAMVCTICGYRSWGEKWESDPLFTDRLKCPACFHVYGDQFPDWKQVNELIGEVDTIKNNMIHNFDTLKLQLDRIEKHLSAIDYGFAVGSHEFKRHFGIEDMD